MKKILLLVAAVFTGMWLSAQIVFDYPNASATYITGINDATHVCGYIEYPGGSVSGFIRTGSDTIVVNFLPSVNTWLGGINDLGEVIGRYNPTGSSFDYHCFKYDYVNSIYYDMPELDGYELLSPNDINNEGWISGDLKDGAQRRIFTYHVSEGMVTNFVMVGPDVKPTYGGHHVSPTGLVSAYYIDGIVHKSAWFLNGSGFSNTLDLPDPVIPTAHRTRIMGANSNGMAIVSFFTSRTSFLYDYDAGTLGQRIHVPKAAEVHILDINEEGYVAGYYLDSSYVTHGFFQAKAEFDFDIQSNGWNFINNDADCWNEGDYQMINYNCDPYWSAVYGEYIPFPYDSAFQSFPSSSFTSWSDFVNTFSESQFYDKDPNVNYVTQNCNAFNVWKKYLDNEFTGICWGMVSNVLLNYDSLQLLTESYPELGQILSATPPAGFSSVQNDNYAIPKGRISQNKQLSKVIWSDIINEPHLEPFDVYRSILSKMPPVEGGKRIMNIRLVGQTIHGYHAILPYKMERNPENVNQYNIWVYDPNDPLEMERRILCEYVDTYSAYAYNFGGAWTQWTRYGLRYGEYQKAFTDSLEVLSLCGGDNSRDLEYVLLSLINRPDAIITDEDNGGTIQVNGFNLENTIPSSQSVDLSTGIVSKSFDFKLPPGNYEGMTIATDNRPFEAWLTTEGYGTVMFTRVGTEQGDVDHLRNTERQLFYVNNSAEQVIINGTVLTSDEQIGYQYFVDDINISPGQSVGLQIIDATHIMITSNSAATNYNVRIRIFNPETGFWEAVAGNISIGSNVTQLIIPSLTDDTMDGIIIETDADQDGTYEDSEGFDNEGIPNMLLSHYEVNVPNTGADEIVHVSNVGAGNLNWTVVSSPSWITINTGAVGINHGPVEFTVAENTDTEGRQDYIIIEAASPANDQDTVLVIQGQGGGVGIDKIKLSDALVSIMPNPAKDLVQFSLEGDFSGTASYSIYNSVGQLVRESKMRGQKEIINTAEMERGVYQVKFIINGKTIVKKLVLS